MKTDTFFLMVFYFLYKLHLISKQITCIFVCSLFYLIDFTHLKWAFGLILGVCLCGLGANVPPKFNNDLSILLFQMKKKDSLFLFIKLER